MRGGALWIALLGLSLAKPARADAPMCPGVQARIDAEVERPHRAHELLLLAPNLGPGTIRPLLLRADSPDFELSRAAYLAVGLARHSEALRTLKARPWPTARPQRISLALALLALGDGSATGTIAAGLLHPDPLVRLRTTSALARMKQKRPRTLLYGALDDADPSVRLAAAKIHLPLGSRRARKVLLELFDGTDPGLREIAARTLARSVHRFRPDQLELLPVDLQPRAYADQGLRGRRPISTKLKVEILSKDPEARAGAFAAMAFVAELPVPVVRRVAKKVEDLYGPIGAAEVTMTAALMGDQPALDALPTLTSEQALHATMVLWAFTGALETDRRLTPEQARAIARGVERWLITSSLPAPWEARALAAVSALDPAVGVELARTRALGPDGPGLRTALRTLGRSGLKADLNAILSAATRGEPRTRAVALSAAARVCRLLES